MLPSLMAEKLCRVTITDFKGGGHVVEVKASSLFEAVAQAVKLKGGHIATDGFHGLARPQQPIAAGDDRIV
jgi:hypothetical protein